MTNKIVLLVSLILTIFLVSCTTKSTLRFDKLVNATLNNDFLPAIEQIKSKPGLYGKSSELLYNMDIGMLYQYANMYDSSNKYLLQAADIYDGLFTRSITNEAAAVLLNDNVRPYRSKPYELVMLHQFIGFNFLAKQNIDDALVETRRTQLLFNEWERKARDDEKYTNDPMFHYLSSILYDSKKETSDAMISLYKSIDAFKKGPLALPSQIGDYAYYMFRMNNRESDIKQLNLNTSVTKEQVQGLTNEQSEIVVVGYAGRGPALGESTWWGTYVKDGLLILNHKEPDGKEVTMTLPAPSLPENELRNAEKGEKTKSGTTFHIKIALPGVNKLPSETDLFSVNCQGVSSQPVKTIVINDLEKQAEKFIEDTKGSTLTRTIIRVVLRTIAAEKTKENIRTDNAIANLLLNFGTDILTDQMEKADTRSCFFLPKTIQIARIPVKAGGTYSVDVAALNRSGEVLNSKTFSGITVGENEKKFIFYSSFK
jgi:hypothetical protein